MIAGSVNLVDRLSPEAVDTTGLLDARSTVDSLRAQVGDAGSFDSATFLADAETLSDTVSQVTTIDPAVLVRPFAVDTASVIDVDIDPTDYFTPAALALLLQHLALTFAALSLVRDRSTGLFELLRIGPLTSTQILLGKCIAYLCIGAVVAAALTASAVFWLGVPFSGQIAWFAAMVIGVLLASLSLGMVLSSISQTESQAVQFAMLTLLAALFFSGFVLGLDNLTYPVKLISWTLPVTYGIRSFQTVMLLGAATEHRGHDRTHRLGGRLRFDRRTRIAAESAVGLNRWALDHRDGRTGEGRMTNDRDAYPPHEPHVDPAS